MPQPGDLHDTPALGEITRATTGTPSPALAALPLDIVQGSARRLGWVGLCYSVSFLGVFLLHRFSGPVPAELASRMPFNTTVTVIAALLGTVVWVLARVQKLSPYTLLDVGLGFQVAGAALISLIECPGLLPQDKLIHGVSWVAVWLSLFNLVVPASLGKTVLATLASALTGPGMMLSYLATHQQPAPPLRFWLVAYVPVFLMAGWAVLLSRFIYRLSAQVGKARAMGSYELIELLGRGGMGEVWRARHRMLAREAAIKIVRADALCCETPEELDAVRRRFELEAQATAALHSPHTVSLYDYGVSRDGIFYYVMELLQGADLEAFVKRFGPVRAARSVYLLRQACDSLAEAHTRGLVHRDIKPTNIFVCRLGVNCDVVKVLDFGLVKSSKSTGDKGRLTREGATTGTPAFMAPEIALGHFQVDVRADIYGLGCVAYWLLTGKLVFEAGSSLAMAVEHVRSTPLSPSQRTEIEVPPELDRLVLACLEKNPAHRPQSARELSRLLATCPLPEPWTSERAEEWWKIHVPPGPAARTSPLASRHESASLDVVPHG